MLLPSLITLFVLLVWCIGLPMFLIGEDDGWVRTFLVGMYAPVAVALLVVLVGFAVAPA